MDVLLKEDNIFLIISTTELCANSIWWEIKNCYFRDDVDAILEIAE